MTGTGYALGPSYSVLAKAVQFLVPLRRSKITDLLHVGHINHSRRLA